MSIKKRIVEDFKHDFKVTDENMEEFKRAIKSPKSWFGFLGSFFITLIISVLLMVFIPLSIIRCSFT